MPETRQLTPAERKLIYRNVGRGAEGLPELSWRTALLAAGCYVVAVKSHTYNDAHNPHSEFRARANSTLGRITGYSIREEHRPEDCEDDIAKDPSIRSYIDYPDGWRLGEASILSIPGISSERTAMNSKLVLSIDVFSACHNKEGDTIDGCWFNVYPNTSDGSEDYPQSINAQVRFALLFSSLMERRHEISTDESMEWLNSFNDTKGGHFGSLLDTDYETPESVPTIVRLDS